ncbi:nucleoside-diphosphate-sugar epimerase [Mucilaginibacter frigoritolerans]|jgi:nucleoside-diphosphate-sugar epimerase|uniref:Nucleoside-diphosphate-sugar epimerase n=1 Tax=Mucilaginibacter frigoritolerans TaxID=652788 RepID=A0A562TZ25_9SPHI|nr:NAD-dependent epimerase/dehydratase family protein [Mucilaginibacter frigoritolerans]TWI98030.1 nucleoside-diphosphate-sugar epimerase [Mucilaginibacter frigoritolerans]
MTVSILGCGWYGKALAKALMENGISVKGSTTSVENLENLSNNGIISYQIKFGSAFEVFNPAFFECDVLVISIIPKFRSGEGQDYHLKLKHIIEVISRYKIKKVIYISSTGVYGDRNNEVNELTDPEPDGESGLFLAEAEKLFQRENPFKTTIIRFAGLVGPGRHPGRFFAGKENIPNGKSLVNLIHLDDCIGITSAIIKQDAFGYLFNACSPDHPAKADFYIHAAQQGEFVLPQFIDELNGWKIVNSIFVPTILAYQFKVANWEDCDFNT